MALLSKERALYLLGEKEENFKHMDLFQEILADVEARVLKYLGRALIAGTYTEYFNKSTLLLKEFPVTSITSIKIASDQDWTTAVALLNTTPADYRTDLAKGLVWLFNEIDTSYPSVQVVYVGGYATIPQPILRGISKQTLFEYRNRDGIGTTTLKTGDETIDIKFEESSGLLLEVANALDLFRDHNI